MHDRVKESIDAMIGPQPILSDAKKKKILGQLHFQPDRYHQRKNRRSFPMAAILSLIFAGAILATILINNYGAQISMEKQSSDMMAEESKNSNMMEKEEASIATEKNDHQLDALSDQEGYINEIENLKIENEKLENRISILESKLADELPQTVYETTEEHLRKSGFTGTTEDLINQVASMTEIIPTGIGDKSTLHFNADRIILLSHKNVYAEFTNGETKGYLILQFSVEDGKATDWKVIEYFIDKNSKN